MGSDLLEVSAFFSNVEQLFTALEMSDRAMAIIIRQYLNDKRIGLPPNCELSVTIDRCTMTQKFEFSRY